MADRIRALIAIDDHSCRRNIENSPQTSAKTCPPWVPRLKKHSKGGLDHDPIVIETRISPGESLVLGSPTFFLSLPCNRRTSAYRSDRCVFASTSVGYNPQSRAGDHDWCDWSYHLAAPKRFSENSTSFTNRVRWLAPRKIWGSQLEISLAQAMAPKKRGQVKHRKLTIWSLESPVKLSGCHTEYTEKT